MGKKRRQIMFNEGQSFADLARLVKAETDRGKTRVDVVFQDPYAVNAIAYNHDGGWANDFERALKAAGVPEGTWTAAEANSGPIMSPYSKKLVYARAQEPEMAQQPSS